jgi:UDP-N-acetylglucosamine diphosphorylase / glucose-1-phosphate thymidylyltransferase / UDP-N-acetylgalactosamine diphosphorylase / glucosamine-1-phosphate N-acetyltransferase / galactosamine-1-phosphate N-acetyltransferase
MQAIIIAAGKGTRIQPISLTRPKPLFQLMGQTMIEYTLDQLEGIAREVILVLGYKGEMIQKKIGSKYKGIKIRYTWQKRQTGTGSAVIAALKYLDDKFLVLMGDDLYSKKDIKAVIKKFPAIAAQVVKNPKSFGVITAKDRIMINFSEKPERPQSNLANIAMYYLPKSIFKYAIGKSARGEYEFTDYVKQFASNNKLNVVIAKEWMPVPYIWNFFDVVNLFFEKSKKEIKGTVEKGATIEDKVIVKQGAMIKSGTQIIGPAYIGENCVIEKDCIIGPNTIIEDNCKVLAKSVIKDCIVGSKTTIGESTTIKNSIIGINCRVGNNVRFLNKAKTGNIKVLVNDNLIDSNRKLLGSFLGDNVKILDNIVLLPGTKIEPGKIIK